MHTASSMSIYRKLYERSILLHCGAYICGRKTMAVLCRSCGNWIHARCTKIEGVINGLAVDFRCRKCNGSHENLKDLDKKSSYDVETVTDFSYLGDRINSGGGFEVAVTSMITS